MSGRRHPRTTIAALALLAACLLAPSAEARVTVVSPLTEGIWRPALTDTQGITLPMGDGGVRFVAGPAGQPVGIGSVQLLTASGHGDGSAQLYSPYFVGTPLSAIKTLSYSTFGTLAGGGQLPYLRLTLDLDGNGTPDDQIFFEPVYQHDSPGIASQPSIAIGAWQSWNARAGGWWSANRVAGASPGAGVKTLDAIVAAAPQARVVNTSSRNGGVSLSSGVVAADERFDGNVDAFTIDRGDGPTTYDFEPAPAAPVIGVSANIVPLAGSIKVTIPGRRTRRLAGRGERLPLGTIVDASRGEAGLTMALTKLGKAQKSSFHGGVFSVRQKLGRKPLTDITLRADKFVQLCGRRARTRAASDGLIAQSAATKRRRSKRVVARLWGDAKGDFRTKGRNSAAALRGTRWLTQERCDGTLTYVKRGVVSVRNLHTGKVVTVHAGHSYLAPRG